ncbi:MAG: CHAT domain-containing protein [Saprospiraceae bacterium]|nr:CHAT domain-containing protein [Saprospiraceae bacterium]
MPARLRSLSLLLHLSVCLTGLAQPATDPSRWADTLRAESLLEKAGQLHRADQHEQALEKANQAYSLYFQLYGDNHVKTAKAKMFVARDTKDCYRDKEAAALFTQSLTVLEAAADTFQMAICHYYLSLCQRSLRQYPLAHQHAQQAIGLLERDSIRQESLLADFQVGVASVFIDEKNYLAASPVLEKAKAVYTRKKNHKNLGQLSYFIGNAYFGLRDFARAKENYLSSLTSLKNQITPSHSYFNDLQVNIGLCYQKTGAPDIGLAYLLEAEKGYRKLGPTDPRYIGFLQDLGQYYLDEHQYPAATAQLEACLSAKETRFGQGSYYLLGTLRSLSVAYQYSSHFDRAEAACRRAMQIITDSLDGNANLIYRFYSQLAALRLAQGDWTGSLKLCDTALTIVGFEPAHPEKMLPRDYFRELCQTRAQAFFSQYHQTADTALLRQAEYYFGLAAETLHREVTEITVNSSREIMYDRDFPLLEQWLDARMALLENNPSPAYAEAAFQVASQNKAFLLSDAIQQNGSLHFAGVPDSILQTELSLRARIIDAEKMLDLHRSLQADSLALLRSQELSNWREEYDALLRRIGKAYPEYYRLRVLQRSLSPLEIRRQWLAPEQALLMYSLSETRIYVFLLTHDTLLTHTTPRDPAFNRALERFQENLTAYFTTPEPADALYDNSLDTYVALAQALYQKLVLPLAQWLPGRLLIIPEGKLCYLPFEALLSAAPTDAGNFRTYPFWAKDKAISYGFSTDFLSTTPLALKPEKNWLGIAPFAGRADGIAQNTRQETLLPLPFSGREVKAIAQIVGGGDTWLGEQAWPGRFQQEAWRYRILHLATHSRADDRMGDYSYVATALRGDPLPAKDLYQFALATDMVVLSACAAGGGKLLRGEGIIGMVRAFTFAGARSIVASLWVANDQSTANLMTAFYRHLQTGLPKDRALQAARLELLQASPAEAHPFFWTGFRVYGQVAPLWGRARD